MKESLGSKLDRDTKAIEGRQAQQDELVVQNFTVAQNQFQGHKKYTQDQILLLTDQMAVMQARIEDIGLKVITFTSTVENMKKMGAGIPEGGIDGNQRQIIAVGSGGGYGMEDGN